MRAATLFDINGPESRPVGRMVEAEDGIYVSVPERYGMPSRLTEPYSTLQPDLSQKVTRPGDPDYWLDVCREINWTFAIVQDSCPSPPDPNPKTTK